GARIERRETVDQRGARDRAAPRQHLPLGGYLRATVSLDWAGRVGFAVPAPLPVEDQVGRDQDQAGRDPSASPGEVERSVGVDGWILLAVGGMEHDLWPNSGQEVIDLRGVAQVERVGHQTGCWRGCQIGADDAPARAGPLDQVTAEVAA